MLRLAGRQSQVVTAPRMALSDQTDRQRVAAGVTGVHLGLK